MKFIPFLLMFCLLAGCSSLPSVEQFFATSSEDLEDGDNNGALNETNSVSGKDSRAVASSAMDLQTQSTDTIDAFGSIVKPPIMASNMGSYKSTPLTKHVGDYVRNMAQDLVSNMEFVSERTPVAVTHFSLIDSDLKQTNLLGKQMAESFVHEFHKFRMPVIEYKATQFIRVTEVGDFVLSRDFLDLKNSTPIEYVLTGTMTKHQGGYIVNARMLGMQSNVIVASAQSFIPFYIVDALLPSGSSRKNEIVDGVRIIRGE